MSDTPNQELTTTQKILRAIEPLIYARRGLTMGILLIATAFLLWQMLQIRTDAGYDKSIPLEHEYMKVLKQYQADFGGANNVLVALIQKPGKGEIYNEKFLTSLKSATDEVFFLPGVDRSRVSSLFTPDVRFIEVVEGGFKGGNVIPAEYAPTPEMFALVKANVNKGGHVGRYTTKDQTGAMIFSELLEVDPVTGEKLDYANVAALLEDRIRGRFTSPKKYVYTLKEDYVTPDGKYHFKAGDTVDEGFVDLGWKKAITSFNAVKKEEGGDKAEIVPINGRLLDVHEADNPQYNPDIDVHILGFAKVVGDIIDAIFLVVLFFVVTLIMTGLLLWAYLGSFKLSLLPLLCSVTAVIWEFGLLRMAGKGLDPFAILVPFLILAVSVSHGVQYCNAWVGEITQNKRDSYHASLETWRRLAVYGTMAIMTDVVGFALIGLIPIDIIREMALNATLGMLAIIITNKVMMPIWLTWIDIGDPVAFAAKQEKRDSVFDPLWRVISHMVRPVPATIAIVIAAALLGWGLWKGQGLQVGDSQAGVPELLPDSRYNNDTAAVTSNFTIGTDVLKVIAEMEPESCVKFETMDQIDRFYWHMDNTAGVQSTISLPWAAKQVNTAFSEAAPKFKVLPRNQYTMVQAITPLPTSSGLLNPDCSALAVFVFTKDHRAATLERIVDTVKQYNKDNAAEYYETHKDVNAEYCASKVQARREAGSKKVELQKYIEKLKKKNHELTEDDINKDAGVVKLTKEADDTKDAFKKMDKECPVNFALASAQVGVMAATNEEVHRLERPILYIVYLGIIICVYLSFFEWQSIVAIMLPLALVSFIAYAIMTILDIGMKVATLPVVALAAGIGVDYGIYVYATFADACAAGYKMEEGYFKTLKLTGKAVVFTGITLCLGVLTWKFSGLQFQRDMGALLVFMFGANMFGAILLLPAIASFILKPKVLKEGEVPVFKPRH
ncbi:MAG TPA: MMPL family transporter [Nevskiaceae bacterium]|nr:MMPL family transporter [Nevskiaceae bacterium]